MSARMSPCEAVLGTVRHGYATATHARLISHGDLGDGRATNEPRTSHGEHSPASKRWRTRRTATRTRTTTDDHGDALRCRRPTGLRDEIASYFCIACVCEGTTSRVGALCLPPRVVCSVAAWTPSPERALLKRIYSRPCATVVWSSGSSARLRV